MSRRQVTRICAEGWYFLFVVLFVLGGAVLGEVNLLVMLAGFLLGPYLFNWRLTQLSLRQLEIRRGRPPRATAGEPFTVSITAINRRHRVTSWMIMVEDCLRREGDSDQDVSRVRIMLPQVLACHSATARYRVVLPQRGRYQIGPLQVSTRFPFGLVRSSRVVEDCSEILVGPPLGQLTPRWLQMVDSRLQGSHAEGRRQGQLEGDYFGLREWRSGDSQRWIHWRTSAKLGELAVRQFEQQRSRDVIVVLDLWEPDAPSPSERAHTELAISFLATAMQDMARRGGNRVVVCVAGSDSRYWSGPVSLLMAHEVHDHLAGVMPGDGLRIYEVLDRVREFNRGQGRAVVISTRGAPFLTARDEWETIQKRQRPRRTYGNFTWIDCRGDQLRQYFRAPASCLAAEAAADVAAANEAAAVGETREAAVPSPTTP
jgi:uncharacterized protein (DUF58 family)